MSNEASTQNRYAFPRFKVFIYGVEVTADVVSINKNEHDGDSPNTCQLTILNEFDKYILTTKDIIALNGINATNLNIPWITNKTDATSSTTQAQTPAAYLGTFQGSDTFANAVRQNITQPQKRAILLAKNNVVQGYDISNRIDINGNPINNTNLSNYYGVSINQYPLIDGSPVFHSMDPIRVFMRDPFEYSRWYHYFTGFVSDMVDNTDENNTKTLTIIAEDPTKLFRYTRVFINPGIVDANSVIAENDLRLQSFMANAMSGFNLAEVFFTMFFGPDRIGAEKLQQQATGLNGASAISTKLRGIGHFSFDTSDICIIGPAATASVPVVSAADQNNIYTGSKVVPPATQLLSIKPGINIDSLQTWQAILDHEVQLSDIYTMATDADRQARVVEERVQAVTSTLLSNGLVDMEQVCDMIGKNPQWYLPDGGRLLLLIPNSLGVNNRDILVKDIIQSYPQNSEWVSAGSIMFDTAQRIQFSIYCTPKGDFVVEPPMFDFDPIDFGLSTLSPSEFIGKLPIETASTVSNTPNDYPNTLTSVISVGEQLSQIYQNNANGGLRGPFGTKYVVLKKDTYNWESAVSDEKIHTISLTPYALFDGWETLANTSIIGNNIVVKIPDLVPLYGTRCIPLTPRGFIKTAEGARLFAQIALNKMNAEAHTMNISHVPNLQLWVNRPIYIQGRNVIGTTKQVSQSLTWGEKGDMSTTQDLYAIRSWNGDMDANDPTRPVYTPIGGYGAHGFINYAILFGTAPVPNTSSTNQSTGNNIDLSPNLNSKPNFGVATDAINKARNSA